VRRFKNIFVVLVALVWLPASSHTLLESTGLIHEQHVACEVDWSGPHGHDDDNHAAADGKYSSPSTRINAPRSDAIALPILFCWRGLDLISQIEGGHHAPGLVPPGLVPPEFSQRWQFSFRTALPARAPSSVF
jgi:hypothetical protein